MSSGKLANFKGFREISLECFNKLSEEEKQGNLWYVKDNVVTDENGVTTCDSYIYMGTKLYAHYSNEAELTEKEVIKEVQRQIIESKEEPEDKDAIWIQETDETETERIDSDIRSLQKVLKALINIVNRHEHAFSHTMNSGDIYNSAKADMMGGAYPEEITYEGLADEGETEDTEVDVNGDILYASDFELYVANTPLSTFASESSDKYLYKGQRYYLRPVYTPKECLQDNNPVTIRCIGDDGISISSNALLAKNAGKTTVVATMNSNGHTVTKTYDLTILFNEEPDYCEYAEPNVKHLIIKSVNTFNELNENKDYLCLNELIWCEGDNGLYIKTRLRNGTIRLIKINGSSTIESGGTEGGDIIEEIMSGITQNGDSIGSIQFIAPSGNKYSVTVDNEGNLNTTFVSGVRNIGPTKGESGSTVNYIWLQDEKLMSGGLFINSIYCGGINGENGNADEVFDDHSFNNCSHNFVELSNTTSNDINLNGLSIQYADINDNVWKCLPLNGVIKSNSTYLIRGSQCAKTDTNTTVIKVGKPDIEWYDSSSTAFDGKIQFSTKGAKFYLTYGTQPLTNVVNPYHYNSSNKEFSFEYGYVDLVGLDDGSTGNPGAYEGTESKNMFRKLSKEHLYTKYYTLDPAKQANKAYSARTTNGLMYMVDLSKEDGEIIRDRKAYTPKSSKEGKNFYYNKSVLDFDRPTIVTCSFGIKATADNTYSGEMYSYTSGSKTGTGGATRCFNWTSRDFYDEYIWIRKEKTNTWGATYRSINGLTDDIGKHYNRQRVEYTDGSVLTAHKQIVYNIPEGKYEYIVGRKNKDNTPDMEHCSNIYQFEVKKNVTDFNFVQTSDQQGFNWDEYQVWKKSAEYISTNETFDFMINTGDMTQSGNRINEWIDYFNGKGSLSNVPEMATIGNNDLSGKDLKKLGFGSDSDKINPINLTFFYTFEIDEQNPPIFNIKVSDDVTYEKVYVPSIYSFNYGKTHFICINSEVTEETENTIFGIKESSKTNKGYINRELKKWCEKDIELYSEGKTWTVAYCHEMPFTIITDAVMNNFHTDGTTTINTAKKREGSHLNTVALTTNDEYWFSKLCQDKGIRLIIGGHKHTQATTWPIIETDVPMQPIIQVTLDDLKKYFGNSTKLCEINSEGDVLKGHKYPSAWFGDSADKPILSSSDLSVSTVNGNKPSYSAYFCDFELVNKATAPVYAMSQATGYKHTSNKELPNTDIPWLHYYYPKSGTKANSGQMYPFYTVWSFNDTKIEGKVVKLDNIFDSSGKFEVNAYYGRGDKTVKPLNGISETYKTDLTEKIIIKK